MIRWKIILTWTGIAIILGLILWIIPVIQAWHFPAKVNSADVPALVNENRQTFVQIIGGFVLLLALYLTFRRTTALERTVEVTEQGQITERFTRAIEQLGATDDKGNRKLEIRLGGIYALERIAKDSPERDYSTIMEVLTAYVRENAPLPPRPFKGFSEVASASNEPTTTTEEGAENSEMSDAQSPTADVYAILDVLRRREEERVPEAQRTPLDLRRSNLYAAVFQEANLREAVLQGANLRKAVFYQADLQKADLTEADLREANLRKANLREADLSKSVLYRVAVSPALLQGADLRKAVFYQADLRGANFSEADLTAANFFQADLSQATLRKANLYGANLYRASLQRAILESADLRGAHLRGTDFTEADLSEADLRDANLSEEQIGLAIGDEATILPEGFTRPAIWSKSFGEQYRIVEELLRQAPDNQ